MTALQKRTERSNLSSRVLKNPECTYVHAYSSKHMQLVNHPKMSYEKKTSRIDGNSQINKQLIRKRLPEKPSSPLMFDDDVLTAEVYSQINRSSAFNQLMPSQSPPEWTQNIKIQSIRESGGSPAAVFLSMSQIERVSTCHLCDNGASLNDSTDFHNRSITDVARITLHSDDSNVMRHSPKRARLNEPLMDNATNVSVYSIVTDTSDIFTKINDQAKAIDSQLVALHEDW